MSTISVTAIFLATLFFIVATPNVTHAQTIVPNYYGWEGYNGNHTVYLSTDIPSNNPRYIDNLNAQANISTNSSSMQPNALYMALSYANVNGSAVMEQFSNNPALGTKTVVVYIPFSMSSVGYWETSLVTNDPPNDYEIYPFYDNMTVTNNGLPTSQVQIQSVNNLGLNVSGPNLKGTTTNEAIKNMLIDGFGLIPDYGTLASVYGVSKDWESLSGVNAHSLGSIGNGSGFENFRLMTNRTYQGNGAWTGLAGYEHGGYDIFGSFMYTEVTIPTTDFFSGGSIVVSGSINYQKDDTGNTTASTASITLHTAPAYTIQGTVYNLSGQKAVNTAIELETSTANYFIKTNSTGQYRFFAKPGVDYFLTTPSTSIGGVQINPSSSSTGGHTYNLHLTNLTFLETGIVGSQSWSVTLTGYALPSGDIQTYTTSTTTSNMTTIAVLCNESYSYRINPPSDYVASPRTSSVNVGSTAAQVNIQFTPENTYSVTFTESGLPSGISWRVVLAGYGQSTTSTSNTFTSMPDGNYSYSVSNCYVYSYPKGTYYFPSPSSGTIHVSGGNVNLQISYHAQNSVSGNTPILMTNGTYLLAENIHVGMQISTYNTTTNSIQSGPILTVMRDNQSTAYIVNGFLNLSSNQLVLTNKGWLKASELSHGDRVMNPLTGKYTRVHSIQVEQGNITMYGFIVGTNNDYVAWHYVLYGT